MPRLGVESRSDLLDRLEGERFDVVVIGGGITGAGVARDAAHRGLRVALLEGDDFASGTSSRSSKLIHGGLRYLAMGEVGLVRETALERKAVHRMAPHLAEPCWMVVPARNRASLIKFRAGIGTYEKLGKVEGIDRHHSWDQAALVDHEPHLRRDSFPWACAYREYVTDDARLVLAVLRDAVRAGSGATVIAGRVPVVELSWSADRVDGVVARCEITGRRVEVSGESVVNAAGPWVESLARMEAPGVRDRLHLSKGVHIVVPADRFPVRNLVVLGTDDKRAIFAVPRGDTVALGTTDTSYRGDRRRWPEIGPADVEYLLAPIARYFDVDPITPADVVAAWSGLRPLVAQPGKDPREISRKDEVWIGAGGMVTVAGGKLTGFRAMAITVMEAVAERLDQELRPPPGPEPIPGGGLAADLDAESGALAESTGVDPAIADRLVRLYGSEAPEIVAAGAEPLVSGGRVVVGEVAWAVEVDGAHDLEDVIYRRTRAAWYRPSEREALLAPVAERMADLLGWDDARGEKEIAAVRARFAEELAFVGAA
ncbi:MAG: FAD-dependent oxidoreductase [Acidimicrobiales bacterium]